MPVHDSRWRSRALALLLLAIASCHRVNLDQQRWLELSSDHFLLRTDLDEEAARATVIELEQTRSVFLRALAWGGEAARPTRPFLVVEVDDLAELHEFARPEIEGFASEFGLGQRLVAISAEQDAASQTALKHELAHAIAGQTLRRQPAWFAEGLACFLENTAREPGAGRDIIGEIDEARVRWLAQHTAMPAAQVFTVTGAAPLNDRDGARFESSAYEIFFMLFNQRATSLAGYMRRLAQGDEPQAAFAALFPDLTPEKIDALVLDSQVIGAHYTKLGVPLEPYRGAIAVRALGPAELHAQLGVLFALSPGLAERTRPEQRARAEFAQALALDPGNPEALDGLSRLERSGPGEQLEAARRATALHSDSWRAWMLLADAAAQQAGQPDPTVPDEALEAARTAATLAPDEPSALARYAGLLGERGQPADALQVAQRAVERDPADPNGLLVLARQLGVAHREGEALAMLQRAIELTPEHAPRRFVTTVLELKKQLEAQQLAALHPASLAAPALDAPPAPGAPQHDVRMKIDRAPVQLSCPTRGPAIPRPLVQPAAPRQLSAEVRYVVGDDGKVKRVERIAGPEEAVAAIRRWLFTCTYEPGRRGGQPIDSEVQEVFSFVSR